MYILTSIRNTEQQFTLYIPIFELNLLQLYNIYRKKSFKSLYLFVSQGILKLKIDRVYAIFELFH